MRNAQELCDLADAHLPPEIATRWKQLLRPAMQFDGARRTDAVALQLGGNPELPVEMPWPEWEGHGPLTFIASLDCAMIDLPDLPLPESGTLLFFYFDGQVDGGEALAGAFAPGTQDGARLIYVPAGAVTKHRPAPEPIEPYMQLKLQATPVITAPERFGPRNAVVFGDGTALDWDHPICADEFVEAMEEEVSVSPCHQVGGYPISVQGPVEYEVNGDDEEGAEGWLLLAQFDTDRSFGMEWGDNGMLYWLIQEPDLVAGRFDRAVFTWQCC